MSDTERAKEVLEKTEGATCVLVKGEAVHTAKERGIAPLLKLTKSGDYSGYCAADKVVGKAAALMYALLGVKEVYADVLSVNAKPVLERAGIAYTCKTETEYIVNRRGDGMCPMEETALSIDDPAAAPAVFKAKLALLSK